MTTPLLLLLLLPQLSLPLQALPQLRRATIVMGRARTTKTLRKSPLRPSIRFVDKAFLFNILLVTGSMLTPSPLLSVAREEDSAPHQLHPNGLVWLSDLW
jgi:hypothetical protein